MNSTAPATTVESDWPNPRPLPTALLPVATLDTDILPATLKPWVKDIAERMQVPPDFPAIGLMISLAGVVGRKVCIRPKRYDTWEVVPNLWGAVVGRPGVLKSPALDEALRPLRRIEAQARDIFLKEKQAFEARQLAAKMRKIRPRKEGEEAEPEEEEEEECEPIERRYIVSDVTPEKLGELLAVNSFGMTLVRDELMGLLRQLEKQGQESGRAFLLEAWNGNGSFVFDRIQRGTTRIEACCLSILGGIQPGPLKAYRDQASKNEAGDDGFIQRFQLLVWPDVPNDFVNVDRWPDKDAKNAVFDLFDRIDKRDGFQCGGKVDQDDRRGIPYVRFTPKAQAQFDQWRIDHEVRVRSGELAPAMESHLAKYRSLVPSIALLTHLADDKVGPVPESALCRAIEWAKYLETHAARVYGLTQAQAPVEASAMARKIIAGELKDAFTSRGVYQRDWSHLKDAEAVKRAATYLEKLGWLRASQMETGGRPSTLWEITPRLSELESEPAKPPKPLKVKTVEPEAEPFEGFGGSPREDDTGDVPTDAGELADAEGDRLEGVERTEEPSDLPF